MSAPETIDAYCTLGVDREYNLTEAGLIAAMDAAGVSRAVIAPPDRHLAVHNREGNQAMLNAAGTHPDRLIPACCANPWYGDAAIAELERSLAGGARLFVFHPFIQGFSANDELIFPALELAARERVPVYVHTGPPGNATPWQIVDLAGQYPSVDFIMGHCGATDFWNDVALAAEAAGNVYIESSLARPFNFAAHIGRIGAARGIMGSWAPLNDMVFEWEQMRQVLPPGEWAGIYGPNLSRLLARRGPL